MTFKLKSINCDSRSVLFVVIEYKKMFIIKFPEKVVAIFFQSATL